MVPKSTKFVFFSVHHRYFEPQGRHGTFAAPASRLWCVRTNLRLLLWVSKPLGTLETVAEACDSSLVSEIEPFTGQNPDLNRNTRTWDFDPDPVSSRSMLTGSMRLMPGVGTQSSISADKTNRKLQRQFRVCPRVQRLIKVITNRFWHARDACRGRKGPMSALGLKISKSSWCTEKNTHLVPLKKTTAIC